MQDDIGQQTAILDVNEAKSLGRAPLHGVDAGHGHFLEIGHAKVKVGIGGVNAKPRATSLVLDRLQLA